MKRLSFKFVFALVAITASFLTAQPALTSPSDRLEATGFSLAPANGALSWRLPLGTVPGAIPVPVVFRYQASMTSTLT